MSVQIPVRIQTGAPVRIDGKSFFAGPVISGGRVFYDKEAGTQVVLSEIAQMKAIALRLRDDAPFEKLSAARRHTLRIDWGTFTPIERKVALTRALYVRKLDKVEPSLHRSKKKVISRIVEEIGKKWKIPEGERPSPRRVRTWYRTFVTAGRDVRALVNCNWAKGNRTPRYEEWQREQIDQLINEKIVSPTPSSMRTVRLLANSALQKAAAERGENLNLLGKNNKIGGKLVARMVRERNKFEVMVDTTNRREAERQMQSVQLGPQGKFTNHQWEVDHHLLDILVIDEKTRKIAGRPWMTAIIDRYSRCIVGFSLSFAPPSWTSVMDALRIAVMGKDWIVTALGGIKSPWDCVGSPKYLITDHGRDFKSDSMAAACNALEIDLKHSPPRKPWFKGKIERWFGTLEQQIVHTIPGTVLSKWEDRQFYNSEEFAVLTIHELNWIVAKWVIDIYHHDRHSKLGCTPMQKYKEGLQDLPLLRTHAEELIVPMMGLVIPRTLRKGGIRYQGLRWDSEDFGKIRAHLPDSANVPMRLDPLDVSVIYIHDEKRGKWFEGHLVEPVEARGLALNQWCKIAKLRRRIAEDEDLSNEQALAEAFEEIDEYLSARISGRLKSKAPKRFADFQNRTAWSAIRPDRKSLDQSAPGSHTPGLTPVQSPPLQNYAPFSEPGQPVGSAANKRVETKTPRVGKSKLQVARDKNAASHTDIDTAHKTQNGAESGPKRQNGPRATVKLNIRPPSYGGRGAKE